MVPFPIHDVLSEETPLDGETDPSSVPTDELDDVGEADEGHWDPVVDDIMEALITDDVVAEGGDEKDFGIDEDFAVCDKSVGSEREIS